MASLVQPTHCGSGPAVVRWPGGSRLTLLPETLLSLNDLFFLILRTKLGGNRTNSYFCRRFVLDVDVQKEAGNTGL